MNVGKSRLMAVLGAALCIGLVSLDTADAARRGGSFGSRGSRTYQAPRTTQTAPQQAAPIQRSMTQPAPGQQTARPGAPAANRQQAQAPQQQRRGGFLGGLGGGILGGLLAGGLIGALMGNGFGAGMAGMAAMLMQIALIAGIAFLAFSLFKMFRRRQQPAMAGAANNAGWSSNARSSGEVVYPEGFGRQPQAAPAYTPPPAPEVASHEIGVTGQDRETFERLLMEIQDAFGREDYAALRERTTPEVMGYLAEELGQNATEGRHNEISDTKLLEADIAEAWHEEGRDYATAAMRYEFVDVVRERATGAILEGDPNQRVQKTEVWTFVRQGGGQWKLSAIQEA
ncbi:TIM44-like domain-containing protein [Caulobacter segnis]|uniref:TIM44-like domain-containing protein n=1 Tax=Caulobacter segnis TaxID=88688 RepID=UPI00240FFCC1|nr:TIM44-like domain-containing protein [Caulobacter segnis]MDG2521349.1 TIM44-like domain-containing protein [Caulobacter segnis]